MPDLTAYVRRCRSCDAPIIWARTINGKTMPVDAEPTEGGNVLLEIRQGLMRATVYPPDATLIDPDLTFRLSHFTTCPDAQGWRKGRG